MLTLHSVSKYYDNLAAVDGVSLTVEAGRIIGLIGPNGSGKSTLLSVIAGTLQPSSGRIEFDGRDITHAHADAIFRLGLARSFQDPSLFLRMTVLDNALLPVKDQRGERPLQAPWHRRWRNEEGTHAAAALAELSEVQLGSLYDRPAAELSGGQMKLLELARGMMGRPRLLLLDEPTAGVAPKLAYDIFEHIERLRREGGVTFLIVEHRLEILFDYVDSLYVMHMGRIIAHGTPDEVADDAQVREVYFGE